MKAKITAFINDLIIYDYILFASVFLTFILLLILLILLRRRTFIAVILFLLLFSTLILGPTLGYIEMHKFLFKNETSIINQKKLTFTKGIVVNGSVKNISKKAFTSCKITVSAYKVSGNVVKDYILKFKPFKKMSILEYDIAKDEVRDFKVILDSYKYSKDYNISIGADCR